ncbi:MAG TPA: ATP-binding protein [Bryobacteraceae bacterium]|nr:ATP-binding protein [Bryobacteraceae bacterium]
MSLATAASLGMAFLGLGLCLFLSIVLFSQRRIGPAGLAVWILAVAFGIWHVTFFVTGFFIAGVGRPIAYAVVWNTAGFVAIVIGFACALWLLALAYRLGHFAFVGVFGVSLLLAVFPVTAPYSTTGPPFFLAWFLYWHHSFGLQLSRRSMFALTLGVSAAIYLFLIRTASRYVERKFQATGWLVELPLLFWAGILWLPLYAWISRFLNKRALVYSEFGKTVIQEASLILDLPRRVRFLARQISSRFELKTLILCAGRDEDALEASDRLELERFASSHGGDVFYVPHMETGPARDILQRMGYRYLFPLRYEKRLSGLMLIDTSALASLDENELVLVALAPQISQSIEAGRLVEEKIGLERELLRQEHLAGLGKVAATIAHEIKNPLSAIKTIAQVMREDQALSSQYAEDLGFIVSEVDRLDQSVRQLLGFSSLSAALDQEVDLSSLVASIAAALSRQAQPLGVRVESTIAPGVTVSHSNRELLQQIVLNVTLNAIQASREGQTVTVILSASGELTVQDEGPGIPADLREKVFEPFFTTRLKGTGLGLAIVRKNAEMLGAEVMMECPAEGGTRVNAVFRIS